MLGLGANGRGRAGLLSILRPQDVFATSLYTGTGASQQVTTGFAPDLTWRKRRDAAQSHLLFDRLRGATGLSADSINEEVALTAGAGVNGTGFATTSVSGSTNVAWSFRRAPKFFDIVIYTGNGATGRKIPHGLGVVPGMIVVKRRDAASSWAVYHASLANPETNVLVLESTNAATENNAVFGAQATSTDFTVGTRSIVNASGATYVAYLFAHDPDATGIIQCGSFTGAQSVVLGWSPQFLMFKSSTDPDNWQIRDAARNSSFVLYPNLPDAEVNAGGVSFTGTGFNAPGATGTNIYLAFRAPIT